jgi:hypothetical protein
MPSIEPTVATKHHEIKQELLKKFTRPRDQQQMKQPAIQPGQGQKKGTDRAAPDLPKEKDQDR